MTAIMEVFGDVWCPFTHIALRRVIALRDRVGGESFVLRVRAWPLELVNGEPLAVETVAEEVDALRDQVDVDAFAGFDPSRFPRTSLPALALAAGAYDRDDRTGERVSLALRHALFEEGRDISDPDVLADVAARHGLDPRCAADDAAVRADWDDGRRRGVEGSPHFFAGQVSAFSPGLDVSHVDGRLRIRRNDAALEAVAAAALAGAG
jgi:predicted DsbA family dithiol-disulfide isomerase